jgi:hypothetical protein
MDLATCSIDRDCVDPLQHYLILHRSVSIPTRIYTYVDTCICRYIHTQKIDVFENMGLPTHAFRHSRLLHARQTKTTVPSLQTHTHMHKLTHIHTSSKTHRQRSAPYLIVGRRPLFLRHSKSACRSSSLARHMPTASNREKSILPVCCLHAARGLVTTTLYAACTHRLLASLIASSQI